PGGRDLLRGDVLPVAVPAHGPGAPGFGPNCPPAPRPRGGGLPPADPEADHAHRRLRPDRGSRLLCPGRLPGGAAALRPRHRPGLPGTAPPFVPEPGAIAAVVAQTAGSSRGFAANGLTGVG